MAKGTSWRSSTDERQVAKRMCQAVSGVIGIAGAAGTLSSILKLNRAARSSRCGTSIGDGDLGG